MEQLIQAKRHFSKLGLAFAATTIGIYILQTLLVKVVRLINPALMDDTNVLLALSMIPMYLVAFPLLALVLIKKFPRTKPERHKMTVGQYVVAAIMCMGLAYLANLVGNALTMIIGNLTGNPVKNSIMDIVSDMSPMAVLIYTVLLAPVAEELVFRKLIVDHTLQYGDMVAIILSGLFFALFHGNLNQFVYTITIGMFLAYLYVRTGNIKITISLHMLFNFMGGFISTLLIQNMDMEAYSVAAATGDMNQLMQVVMKNPIVWAGYGLLLVFIFGTILAATVLTIVCFCKKKFIVNAGEIDIPRQIRYSLVFGNIGMAIFVIIWLYMLISQLFE